MEWIFPSWPLSMTFLASATPLPWRRCVPTTTMRLYLRAAWIIHLPSSMNRVIGFSTYTSLPAAQAMMVSSACQWSGVATTTPWMSLFSYILRKSLYPFARGFPMYWRPSSRRGL